MALKKKKPNTPGQRGTILVDYSSLSKKKPEKGLVIKKKKTAGRSKSSGRITVRHKGGGVKKKYRVIDFKREKIDVPATVKAIEYDPNRTCFIALLFYKDGEKRYIIAPDKLKIGDIIVNSKKTEIKPGNRMLLKSIPAGTTVHDIELYPKQGGMIVRSAGAGALVMSHDSGYVQIKLPSTEIRLIKDTCSATIGQVSNFEHGLQVFGKAGRSRWKGVRPTVRGSAMNPVDHPHGGGEGRTGIGLRRGPKTPWGKLALGVKTRRKKKPSNRFIIKRRKPKKKK